MAQAPDTTARSQQEAVELFREVLNNYLRDPNLIPVKDCVKTVSYAYNNMRHENVDIDFEYEGNRIAYVYMYFMQHCFFIYSVLCQLQQHIEDKFKPKGELKVCCIGGGPGTDLVGLIVFLQEKQMLPRTMHCTIVDKNTEWQETWEKIWMRFPRKPKNFQIEVSYESCDLLEASVLPRGVRKAVCEADIVTMITAYGGLYRSYKQKNTSRGPIKLPRLKMICDKMAKESTLLFIDKENGFHYETVFWENHAKPADMNRVLEPTSRKYSVKKYFNHALRYPHIDRFIKCMPRHLMYQCEVTVNIFEPKK